MTSVWVYIASFYICSCHRAVDVKNVKIWYNLLDGSVAQWIEQLRPKEKVVRSTRARATKGVGLFCL